MTSDTENFVSNNEIGSTYPKIIGSSSTFFEVTKEALNFPDDKDENKRESRFKDFTLLVFAAA